MSKAIDLVIEKNQKNIETAVASMNVFRQQIDKAKNHLETLVNYRLQCQETIQNKAFGNGVKARDLLNQHSFITQVDKAISQQLNHAKACEVFFSESKDKVKAELRTSLKLKTAKKIITKKSDMLAQRREQKAVDEVAANLYAKKEAEHD